MDKNGKKRVKAAMIMVAAILITFVAIVGASIIKKYTPTKEVMDSYEYFDIEEGGVVVIYNDERVEEQAEYIDGRWYITRDFVKEEFNKRFYLDVHDNYVMYTTADDIYSFVTDGNTYTDMEGNEYSRDYVIVRDIDGEIYIALDFVKEYSDLMYEYYENPMRLIINNVYEEKNYAVVEKDAAVRYRGGIKSPIITQVSVNDRVEVLENLEDWIEIRTEDGYVGYIPAGRLSDTYSEVAESGFAGVEEPVSNLKDYKICLVWHQLFYETDGTKIRQDLTGTKGVTTVSPTWYSIQSNDGDISSLANKNYVNTVHGMGLEVWPLIDDFNTELNGYELYSDRQTRAKIISTLIEDALYYGYDGLNIDFEKVTSDDAEHYLQFIRELSIQCRKNNITLSVDCYTPASYNLYYDRTELGIYADYIIIMGYDEHYNGTESGSVASIGFVESGIANTLEEVDASKVINAMPFYTRIWTETTGSDGTVTITSEAVGMQGGLNELTRNGALAMWDETCGQYYGSYEKGNSIVKVWLEEEHSIEEKMKLFEEYNLAGVAAWKLGLEKSDVWSVINKYLE